LVILQNKTMYWVCHSYTLFSREHVPIFNPLKRTCTCDDKSQNSHFCPS